MSKAEVPISYIIALILGVAVVAIIGYWFFVVQSQGGGEMTMDRCRSAAYTYCNIWRDTGYAVDQATLAPNLGLINGGTKWFSLADTAADVAAYSPSCSTYNMLDSSPIGHTIGSKTGNVGMIGACEQILSGTG
ncbi:MAG: hypothetical protein NT016_02910 [Candidatus Aenigmarchaeota archaeon]|nr:hypothetical protein [Candidatus Aenigmarchaeota archaeon]